MIELVAIAIAAGTAAFTLTRTKISDPMRSWLTRRSKWVGALFSCPFCLGHWLSAIAVLIYQPRLTDVSGDGAWVESVLDWGVAWLVVTFLAALTSGVCGRAIKWSLP